MEYKLNKIDPEVRQRIKETTSSGKVHAKSGIVIGDHNKNKRNESGSDFNSKLEKEKNKNKNRISVDAVKIAEVQVPAYKEDMDNLNKDETKGHILDVKK